MLSVAWLPDMWFRSQVVIDSLWSCYIHLVESDEGDAEPGKHPPPPQLRHGQPYPRFSLPTWPHATNVNLSTKAQHTYSI